MSRFKVGDRVRVKAGISVPDWATKGTITTIYGPNSDYYGYVRVRWDLDLKQRRVSESWLLLLSDRNYISATCTCGRIVRMSPTTYEQGGVTCDLCGTGFKVQL